MVYKNLPIEIDARGQVRMRAEVGTAPFGVKPVEKTAEARSEHDRLIQEVIQRPTVRYYEVEPLTRSSSRPSLRAVVDLEHRLVLDARVEETSFRSLGLVLKNRPPSDAVQIASRLSGVSSGANAITAALAIEMACSVPPPPLATIARGLGAAAEMIYLHVRALFLMAGPDYSEQIVAGSNPSLWAKAEQALAPGAEIHGFKSIGSLMSALNPMSGQLYREALQVMRGAADVVTLVYGKYPHPSSIVVAGIGLEADKEIFNQALGRLNQLIDYAKKAAAVWDDLTEFFYAADERYRYVGALKANLISAGVWDDPASYNARFENCNEWAVRRYSTPGVVIAGELRTTRLTELNAGMEEFVDHSFFESTNGHPVKTDSNGAPLSPLHPWNRQTSLHPTATNWTEHYSWNTAPRWDREPMETGPLARQWITAAAGKLKNEFIEAFGKPPLRASGANGWRYAGGRAGGFGRSSFGLEIALPRFQQSAARLKWTAPEQPNAFERNRARAYAIGYCGAIAFTYLLKAFDALQRGEKRMSSWFGVPKETLGAGFWECASGILTHHVQISEGKMVNYQITPSSTWLASPRDPFDTPGPYEQAMMNTPLLEEFSQPEDFVGIDLLRAIRSFDP
jgi:hydrogenase large subunit